MANKITEKFFLDRQDWINNDTMFNSFYHQYMIGNHTLDEIKNKIIDCLLDTKKELINDLLRMSCSESFVEFLKVYNEKEKLIGLVKEAQYIERFLDLHIRKETE